MNCNEVRQNLEPALDGALGEAALRAVQAHVSTCVQCREKRERLEAVRALADSIRPLLLVCEIRTIAADRLWLSPQYECDTIAIHFSWKPAQQGVERLLVELESALAPFAARPHWGKLFLAKASDIASLYERLPDFARLAQRLDPRGAFRNSWLEHHVLNAP